MTPIVGSLIDLSIQAGGKMEGRKPCWSCLPKVGSWWRLELNGIRVNTQLS